VPRRITGPAFGAGILLPLLVLKWPVTEQETVTGHFSAQKNYWPCIWDRNSSAIIGTEMACYGTGIGGNRMSENRKPEENSEEDALIAFLDGHMEAGESRIKIEVVEGEGGVISRQYHHGRCDVGSPWACGTAFDVLE
jgi:hypothetical protein